jgi:hypothetical protein
MPERAPQKVRDLLLRRQGLVFFDPDNCGATAPLARAVELELAQLGYVASARLSAELAHCSATQLAELRAWSLAELLAHAGGDQKHVPLFRRFPHGVPDDTLEIEGGACAEIAS